MLLGHRGVNSGWVLVGPDLYAGLWFLTQNLFYDGNVKVWLSRILERLKTRRPNCTGSCLSFELCRRLFLMRQNVFLSFFFFHARSWRLFLQTRGCCTSTVANTQEQEANVSMKVHKIEADRAQGKQWFCWGSFWWPIRSPSLHDLPLPLPAFMCLGLLGPTQWPLIKDGAKAVRRQWRRSYQILTSHNSARPPRVSDCITFHTLLLGAVLFY